MEEKITVKEARLRAEYILGYGINPPKLLWLKTCCPNCYKLKKKRVVLNKEIFKGQLGKYKSYRCNKCGYWHVEFNWNIDRRTGISFW